MEKKPKYLTKTIMETGEITPWLASAGELAYTSENPPAKKYFFQYSWILPEILSSKVNRRCHFYFGCPNVSEADFLFEFWEQVKNKNVKRVAVYYGKKKESEFFTPLTIYRYRPLYEGADMYLLIQHGSYQLIGMKSQPFVNDGKVVVCRGIGKSKEYKQLNFDISLLNKDQCRTFKTYLRLQAETFSDSALSFRVAHERIYRCETDFLNNEALWDDLAKSLDPTLTKNTFFKKLRSVYQQSFTLDENMASRKFGPNYASGENQYASTHSSLQDIDKSIRGRGKFV